METIYFATGNSQKIKMAQALLKDTAIDLRPVELDIDEIQAKDPEIIVRDKAQRAYDKLKMPVIVSDDTWHIKALNGFPGAYMKSINYWFTPDDFMRLMHGIEDRTINLRQYFGLHRR
jgi:inosine/xanthosine triphosphate pyrophosphatase family protein